MPINKLRFTFLLCLLTHLATAQLVTTPAQLQNAINAATPGTTITLADGEWNNVFISVDKNGTAAAPITITAQNPGAVLMTGNSRVYLEGTYLTVSGLVFQDPENLVASSSEIEPVIELKRCDYCQVINNKIDRYNGTEAQKAIKFKWILADGQYNEIAYNSFIGKYGIGSIINDNRNTNEPDYLRIHHNYFADRTPINQVNDDNDQDAIRIGNSGTSLDDSFTEVYDNYFYNFVGEVEVISNKSGNNKYYNNTFRAYSGTLTLRHGDNCEVFNNYFFAENYLLSGGIRVIGEGHKIYNNYIEGINSVKPDGSRSGTTGAINVSNGRPNSELNGYFQVKNAQIVNNTFVNCDYGFRIGTSVSSTLTIAPENLTVANNIMFNSSLDNYQIQTTPTGTSISEGNLGNLSATALTDDGSFHRLADGSAAIDASVGTYPFVTQDILGGNRNGSADVGAEEFGANGSRLPYDSMDVGINVGFGALAVSNPSLTTSPTVLNFSKSAETLTFEIISNVNWEITENISWLELDLNSGVGSTTMSATVIENTTGVERTGEILIEETAGGSNLSALLMVVQSNTFVPREIQIIGATSVGKEDKPEIENENAYNDDLTNYWTGDPGVEPEVSITFDLGCIHELTEIGIHFWKADERTTTFSIAVADDAAGPFTTVINEATSEAGTTVATEQFFNLSGIFARYVKFIGIGNSSSSNWTSIANVNIYGNPNCEGITKVSDKLLNPRISIFPVPVKGGVLHLSSSESLGAIRIFNATGQQVLMANGNRSNSNQIDVSHLKSGIYFLELDGMIQGKFMVED